LAGKHTATSRVIVDMGPKRGVYFPNEKLIVGFPDVWEKVCCVEGGFKFASAAGAGGETVNAQLL